MTWFIGFSEGDGNLFVHKDRCYFTIRQKEESILQEIQSVLGFEKVYFNSSTNTYAYKVNTSSDILKLAILFNGKLATKNKISKLENWFILLKKYHENIESNPNTYNPSENYALLSGF